MPRHYAPRSGTLRWANDPTHGERLEEVDLPDGAAGEEMGAVDAAFHTLPGPVEPVPDHRLLSHRELSDGEGAHHGAVLRLDGGDHACRRTHLPGDRQVSSTGR